MGMGDKGDLDDLLRKREEIDSELHQFKQHVAVMFADIKSSTDYFDRWGDLEGRLMVKRCEDVMMPVLEKGGAGIKRMGDGVMAYFEETEPAVRAAMEIQRGLQEHNRDREERLQLHLRIGINAGLAIVEENDISGDVVNVAKRVESLAPVDGICVSRSVYEEVRNADDIICRFAGEHEVKGKAEPIRIYQVKWTGEELVVGSLRGEPGAVPEAATGEPDTCFFLEVHSEGEKVHVRSHEGARGEEKTLKFYEDADLSLKRIENYAAGIKDALGKANRRGKVGGEILKGLKQTGQLLYEELLPPRTRERLNTTGVRTLVLNLDEGLVHIPWELIYDGKEFLCRRFNLGRVVSTRQDFKAGYREIGMPLRMLLLADPQGNLPSSYDEGISVRDMLDEAGDVINVSLKTSNVTTDYAKAKLRFFDIVHYAGHAEYDATDPPQSGFLLSDGKLRAKEIRNMVGRMPFPSLVVSNACRSGETEEWKVAGGYEKVFGLANAFLLSGVRHYLGTFWDIQDEPSRHFSLVFYRSIVAGAPVGEAVRRGRRALVEKYGEDTILWASYLLYGDPTFRYVEQGAQRLEMQQGSPGKPERETADSLRAGGDEDVVVFPSGKKKWPAALLAALGLLLVAGMFLIAQRGGKGGALPPVVAPAAVPVPSPEVQAAKNARVDELVRELARKFREGGIPVREPADSWRSLPVSIVFLDVKGSGIADLERDFLLAQLVEDLQESGTVRVVDRELLDKLLAELRLSASELADSSNVLRLGRILAARLIVTGGIIRDRDEWMVSLRIIETETSAVKGAITSALKTKDRSHVAGGLAGRIVERIERWYPVRGRITGVDGKRLRLDIGGDVGLKNGTTMVVLDENMSKVGEIRTTAVREGAADALVIAADIPVGEGMKVAVPEPERN